MKKVSFFFLCLTWQLAGYAQELYPYTEPASNMPAHSLSAKTTAIFQKDRYSGRTLQRYMPELMFGLSRKWMVHTGLNFSTMQQPTLAWEGARLYAKYRFLSNDEVHKHFRMAVYGLASYSRNALRHNEINLSMGDQSGVQGGIIATELRNKFALSATVGWNEVINTMRNDKAFADRYAFQSVNYSLSAGYLLLPVEYTDYNQTNVNLYAELLGGRNIAFPLEKYYVDLAPSVQAIFRSTSKLSVGYRFQLSSDINRFSKKGLMVSFEYIFLDALRRKKRLSQR